MAKNIIKGLTIEIGGDATNLGKALEGVNKQGRDLSAELREIDRLLKLDPGNTELLAQKQKVLAEAVANTSAKLDTLKAAEQQVQQQFERGEVSEEQVRALQREIVATTSKLNGYEQAAAEAATKLDKLGDEAGDTEKDQKSLRTVLTKQKTALDKLQGEYIDVATAQGKNSKEAKELKAKIKALSTEIKTNEAKVESATREVDDLGDEFQETGTQASTFGDKMKSAGAIAAAGLAAIAAAAGAAMTALVKATADAAAYADEMLTMSTVTGVSTDDLQAFSYAAELVDVDVETLTKSMAKNIKSMDSAQRGSAAYADAYKKLGVSVTDANGNLRDGETVYWEAIDALGAMENETERDAIAMQLFGKSAQELNPLIEAGSGKMKELSKEAREVGAVMSEDSLNALGSFDDSLQRLKGSAGAAKNSLGSVLLPELQGVTDKGTDLLNKFTQGLNKSGGGLKGLVSTVSSMKGEIIDVVGDLVSQLLGSLSEVLPTIAELAVELIGELSAVLISELPTIVDTILTVIISAVEGLAEQLPKIIDATAEMIPRLVDVLVEAAPLLLEAVVDLVEALVASVDKILPPLIDSIGPITMAITEAIMDNLPALLDAIIALVMALTSYVDDIIMAILPLLPQIIDAVCESMAENLPTILNAIIELIGLLVTEVLPNIIMAIAKCIPQIVKSVVSGLGKVFAAIGKWFGDLFGKIGEWLGNIGKKIASWFSGIVKQAKDGAGKFVNTVVDFFKQLPGKVWSWLSNVANKIGSWVSNIAGKAKQAGSQFLNNVVSFFKQLPGKVWSWLSGVISKVGSWASSMASKAKTAASNFVSNVVNTLRALPGKVWTWLQNVVSKVASWGSSLVAKAKAAVQKMVNAVVSTVKELPGKMTTAGKNLVQGLWNGISGAYTWLKNKIKGWVGNVTDFLKKLFGIHSPSTVTAWMGKMLDEGLAVGIEDNTGAPLDALDALASDMLAQENDLNGLTLDRQVQATFGAEANAESMSVLNKLDSILHAIEQGQILTIDGDALVGSTLNTYDNRLGQRRALATRGAV